MRLTFKKIISLPIDLEEVTFRLLGNYIVGGSIYFYLRNMGRYSYGQPRPVEDRTLTVNFEESRLKKLNEFSYWLDLEFTANVTYYSKCLDYANYGSVLVEYNGRLYGNSYFGLVSHVIEYGCANDRKTFNAIFSEIIPIKGRFKAVKLEIIGVTKNLEFSQKQKIKLYKETIIIFDGNVKFFQNQKLGNYSIIFTFVLILISAPLRKIRTKRFKLKNDHWYDI